MLLCGMGLGNVVRGLFLSGLALVVSGDLKKAEAVPVRVDLRGEVVGVYDPHEHTNIQIGDAIQGHFTYDTTAGINTDHEYGTDREFYTQSFSNQNLYGLSLQLMLADGPYVFETREDEVTLGLSVYNNVSQDAMGDEFSFRIRGSSLYERGDSINICFKDPTQQALDDTRLPVDFSGFDQWGSTEGHIWWGQLPINTRIDFEMTDVSSSIVPEPSTVGLLGLGGLAFLRSKRRKGHYDVQEG